MRDASKAALVAALILFGNSAMAQSVSSSLGLVVYPATSGRRSGRRRTKANATPGRARTPASIRPIRWRVFKSTGSAARRPSGAAGARLVVRPRARSSATSPTRTAGEYALAGAVRNGSRSQQRQAQQAQAQQQAQPKPSGCPGTPSGCSRKRSGCAWKRVATPSGSPIRGESATRLSSVTALVRGARPSGEPS